MALSAHRLSAAIVGASRTSFSSPFSHGLTSLLLPAFSIGIPAAINLNLPSALSELWDSVLRAVPKKKTSYSKKRSRQLAGKALKDVKALNNCAACGAIKKAHTLCPHCVKGIQEMWKGKGEWGGERKSAEVS